MVQIGDLDVQLVDAETKRPFKEHVKGQVFVEVEPDVEYFISLQKLHPTRDALYCEYYVDGKKLECSTIYYSPDYVDSDGPKYSGLYARANGVETTKALKFQKPKLVPVGGGNSSNASPIMMGQVKIDVFTGIYEGVYECDEIAHSGFSAEPVDSNAEDKKKNLRSSEGTVTQLNPMPTTVYGYTPGTKLYSITLNYCAAPGLVLCGVLPKPPDRWEHHRTLYPASNNSKRMRLLDPKRTQDGKHELFDLSNLESDDDDDDDDEVGDESEGNNSADHAQRQQPEPVRSDVQ